MAAADDEDLLYGETGIDTGSDSLVPGFRANGLY